MLPTQGLLITLDGLDGCGKTTQAKLLQTYCKANGLDSVHIRQPGGLWASEKIREIVLSQEFLLPETELMLFISAWVDSFHGLILPALQQGRVVISERGWISTFAYQGYGRGWADQLMKHGAVRTFIESMFLDHCHSRLHEVCFYLHASRQHRETRKHIQSDRIECEDDDFFQRVEAGYDSYREKDNILCSLLESSIYHRLDTTHSSEDQTHQDILNILSSYDARFKEG